MGGVGLIRQQLSAAAGLVTYDANDLGYNLGGGVVLFVSRNVGIRGDVPHFRSIGANPVIDLIDLQPGAFNYTRATVGVTSGIEGRGGVGVRAWSSPTPLQPQPLTTVYSVACP